MFPFLTDFSKSSLSLEDKQQPQGSNVFKRQQ